MIKVTTDLIENSTIRREWNEEEGKWCFSLVDIVGILTNSTDSRNYWKVLKNRLKHTQNKLVTECNQLKMRANDGKYYLTDTADMKTMLGIIKLISPENWAPFRTWFDSLDERAPQKNLPESIPHKDSYPQQVGEILIDGYQTDDSVIIMTVIAGTPIENILISTTNKILTIKGTRTNSVRTVLTHSSHGEDYLRQELYWGKFSRSIHLPAEVEIDSAVATLSHGLLTIKLEKINKAFTKIIEIKTPDSE